MIKQIFVNLPVKNFAKSRAFFESLGYSFNPQFTNENTGCLVISDAIYAMFLEHPQFSGFAPKPISDAHKTTEVLIALACESRAEVDELVKKAVAAGGRNYKEPMDLGFMYGHGFEDLDGHIWELFYMDPANVQK